MVIIKNQKNNYYGVAPLQDDGVIYDDFQVKAFSSIFTHGDMS